jgi:hypothetical protein
MEAGNIKEEDNPLFKKLRKLISLVVILFFIKFFIISKI